MFKSFSMFFICMVLVASVVSAQETVKGELFKKGIYQFRQEEYDEALGTFKKVMKDQPGSSLVAYYIGLTYKRTENYIDARKYLEDSLTMTPKIKGAVIELIDLLYRLDEFKEAKKWITVAEDEGVRPAQAKFLKGLTLQKSGEYEEAIAAFKDAMDLDDRLAQSANYQIGMCYLRMKSYKSARDVFKEAFELDPYSDLASHADKYLGALERKIKTDKPFHLTTRGVVEYDSNVVLQPTNTAFVTTVADKEDIRYVFDLKGDYTFKNDDNSVSLKTGYGFHYAKQQDLTEYDIMGNNVFVQGNISLGKALITFPAGISHTTVDGENYLAAYSIGNVSNFMINESEMTQIGVIYKYNDYLRSPSLAAENRDGSEIMATGGWFWFLAERKGFINVGYSFIKNFAEGNNWQYMGNKLRGAFLYPILDKLKFSVTGEVFLQNFDNTHSIFAVDRHDEIYSIAGALNYELVENLELQARYTYINEQSNIGIYEYDRDIASLGLQYRF